MCWNEVLPEHSSSLVIPSKMSGHVHSERWAFEVLDVHVICSRVYGCQIRLGLFGPGLRNVPLRGVSGLPTEN